jgi:hypothetical protein
LLVLELKDAARSLKMQMMIEQGLLPKPPVRQKREDGEERIVEGHDRKGKRGPGYSLKDSFCQPNLKSLTSAR